VGRSRSDGGNADCVDADIDPGREPDAATAYPVRSDGDGSSSGREQQEQAQAIVDALADRIRHASGATGLMELVADGLAEVAEAFGAVIDVERLRAALARHWP
jgi:hypothetical protein